MRRMEHVDHAVAADDIDQLQPRDAETVFRGMERDGLEATLTARPGRGHRLDRSRIGSQLAPLDRVFAIAVFIPEQPDRVAPGRQGGSKRIAPDITGKARLPPVSTGESPHADAGGLPVPQLLPREQDIAAFSHDGGGLDRIDILGGVNPQRGPAAEFKRAAFNPPTPVAPRRPERPESGIDRRCDQNRRVHDPRFDRQVKWSPAGSGGSRRRPADHDHLLRLVIALPNRPRIAGRRPRQGNLGVEGHPPGIDGRTEPVRETLRRAGASAANDGEEKRRNASKAAAVSNPENRHSRRHAASPTGAAPGFNPKKDAAAVEAAPGSPPRIRRQRPPPRKPGSRCPTAGPLSADRAPTLQ